MIRHSFLLGGLGGKYLLTGGLRPRGPGFILEASPDGVTWHELDIVDFLTTSYTDLGLTAGTPYYYRVTAFNAAGFAPHSNVASATTS